MRPVQLSAVIVFAILLCSCAAQPEIPYDHSTAGVHSIGIVTPAFPAKANVVLASSVGQSFGLVGALIDAGIQAGRESRFNAILSRQNFSAYETFIQALQEGLTADGYSVSSVALTRPNSGYFKTYPTNSEPQVDAYLDVVVSEYGYLSAGIGASLPYRPHCYVSLRLVSAKDATVLMEQTLIYDPLGSPKHVVTIAPAPAYAFADVGEMEARPADAVAGLRDALVRPAQNIATLLK